MSGTAGPVTALVRPEAVTLASDSSGESGPLTGTVLAALVLGQRLSATGIAGAAGRSCSRPEKAVARRKAV